MLTIRCPCGEVFHADDRHIGYHVRCLHCGQVLPIALPGSQQLDRPSNLVDLSREGAGGTAPVRRWSAWLRGNRVPVSIVAGLLLVVGLAIGLLRGTAERPAVQRPIPLSKPLEEAAPEQRAPAPPDVQPRRETLPARPPLSLPNGTVVYRQQGMEGPGKLRLSNGRQRDAVVTLHDRAGGRKAHLAVYVRAGHETTVEGIRAAVYRIRFMLGIDWEGSKFVRELETFEVLDLFEFAERVKEAGREYTQWELTLHRVPGGTVRIVRISEGNIEIGNHGG